MRRTFLSALVVAAALAPLVGPGITSAFATVPATVVVLGWAPLGVATDGVHTWVTNELTNSVTELDATTGALVRVIAGTSYDFDSPHAVASDGAQVTALVYTCGTAWLWLSDDIRASQSPSLALRHGPMATGT